MLEAIDANNEGHRLTIARSWVAAEAAFVRALALKAQLYPPDDVAHCISLSGRADLYLAWGRALGAGGAAKLAAAAADVAAMRRIAERIRSPQQLRIAREIGDDVAAAQAALGAGAKPVSSSKPASTSSSQAPPRPPGADSLAPTYLAPSPMAGGGVTYTRECPTRACERPGCDATAAALDGGDLLRCGRCHRRYYYGPACQRADRRDHKGDCIAPGGGSS